VESRFALQIALCGACLISIIIVRYISRDIVFEGERG
jgi:hypothetical protein